MKFSEWLEIREAKDACYHKVKARYEVWPSAYASGALEQCRKKGAKNWGKREKKKSKKRKHEAVEPEAISEGTFELEKDRGLRGWFDRNGGKGWVDCRASRKGKIVPCGRKKAGRGADRKYPACRPTLGACNKNGVRRKKGKKRVSWE